MATGTWPPVAASGCIGREQARGAVASLSWCFGWWQVQGSNLGRLSRRGLHVLVKALFTFGRGLSSHPGLTFFAAPGRPGLPGSGCLAGWFLACGCCAGLMAVVVARAGCRRYGGVDVSMARVLRRRWRVLGGRPLAVCRALSSCLACHAARIRWLRTMSRVTVNSV